MILAGSGTNIVVYSGLTVFAALLRRVALQRKLAPLQWLALVTESARACSYFVSEQVQKVQNCDVLAVNRPLLLYILAISIKKLTKSVCRHTFEIEILD